jgi:AraC-like DNA-binding protein
MRAKFEDIVTKKGSHSFLAYEYHVRAFPFLWHYHPEYELTYILSGSGKRMVGDSYEYFTPGDLVLIGPDLPHTWVSDPADRSGSSAVVIQFSEAFIAPFLQYAESAGIRKLLSQSGHGMYFPSRTNVPVIHMIRKLPTRKGMDRITGLLEILNSLSGKKTVPLASSFFQPSRGRNSESRINRVCQYIQRHSTEELQQHKIAALINLSESAFCKFFKRTIGKTYSDYLNEIRVGHSCHLLMESDETIREIAYRSGFESLTYFNRVFLRKKGLRPGEFRKMNGE